jgi:hypothetical protein
MYRVKGSTYFTITQTDNAWKADMISRDNGAVFGSPVDYEFPHTAKWALWVADESGFWPCGRQVEQTE